MVLKGNIAGRRITMVSKFIETLRRIVQFRVYRWRIAMRGWDEQSARVLVECETDIWYWALAEWLQDRQTYLCLWLQSVPLPGFICNWERQWDKEEPDSCKFKDWYGGDFGGIWHAVICDPLMQFIWKHKDHHTVEFELTMEEARNKFAHDLERLKWVEEEIERHKKWDAEEAAEKASAAPQGGI
jgi:hypothetical protein